MVNVTVVRVLLMLAVSTAVAGQASAFTVAEMEANNTIFTPQRVTLSGGSITITGMLTDTPDYYAFEAVYDSYVTVTVTPSAPTIDYYWTAVFDPDSGIAGRARSRTTSTLSNMNIAKSGRYSAVVSGDSSGTTGVSHPFSYSLTIIADDKPIVLPSQPSPSPAVPEPGPLTAVGVGLSGLALLVRRRGKL